MGTRKTGKRRGNKLMNGSQADACGKREMERERNEREERMQTDELVREKERKKTTRLGKGRR